MGLHQQALAFAGNSPERPAILEPTGCGVSYAELDLVTGMLRDRLVALGILPGDRVGVCLRKSADSVACLLRALRAGAAYVPVDPGAPSSRNAYILANCAVKVVLVEQRFTESLRSELSMAGATPELIVVDSVGGTEPLRRCLDAMNASSTAAPVGDAEVEDESSAYILYTSGSTGRPKGVTLSHANACSFLDWCSSVFEPGREDRFAAHAPFHFDLSILDIWLSLKHGASLVIVDEQLGKDPVRLAQYIAESRISIWYSAPSILSLLAQRGRMADHDYRNLRTVLFAGEVFPVSHLRSLQQFWPNPRYYNLYGPTETNVCTFHDILRMIPCDRSEPYPIGKVCSHLCES